MKNTRKKIMMVDDNNAVLQMGKELLRPTYEVYPLPSAEKLFEALEKITPDLFLLDIKMPDTDGFEVLKRLKADERFADIPVIFLTGSYAVENAVKGFGLGAVDYITKPFRNPDFIECVEKHLNKSEEDSKKGVHKNAPFVGFHDKDDKDDKREEEKLIILAVDDSPDILKALHTVLQNTYKVYTLSKPEKLSELLQKVTPNLFLLDYKMPELTGFDLIPIIREFEQHKDTPIIFLTGDTTVDRITAALGMGACDYVAKPFKGELLREKIAKHIL
ncbi:MAG: response regulator [Defluviitaleaceae bacterium]|nr:response regulator [Defluviitaleaceae bacterium]